MGKEAIAPIRAAEADVAIRRLEYIRNALPELQEWFASHPDTELWCFRLFSLEEGLRRLEAFLPEMRRSMQVHAKGKALGPTSSKARKPAKIDPIHMARLLEVKAENDAIEQKQRAAKKKPE
jgi:hypothetical protein